MNGLNVQKINPILYKPIFIFTPFRFYPIEYRKESIMEKRYYYRCLKITEGKTKVDIWHCTHACATKLLNKAYDFILPLDKKPTNATNIKEG